MIWSPTLNPATAAFVGTVNAIADALLSSTSLLTSETASVYVVPDCAFMVSVNTAFEPVTPVAPVLPVTPVCPVAPVTPVLPTAPEGPVGPTFPPTASTQKPS